MNNKTIFGKKILSNNFENLVIFFPDLCFM